MLSFLSWFVVAVIALVYKLEACQVPQGIEKPRQHAIRPRKFLAFIRIETQICKRAKIRSG